MTIIHENSEIFNKSSVTKGQGDLQQSISLDNLCSLFQRGDVIELRILVLPEDKIVAGYFNSLEALIREAKRYDGKANIYFTLNPVHSSLLSRASNRLIEFPNKLTSDNDIDYRRWLLIDIDPVRPSGSSATDNEREYAADKASAIIRYFVNLGWPDPVVCNSGNGMHLLYPVNLPNDNKSRDLIKNCLTVLSLHFDDSTAVVDTSVSNAARIVRFYGTMTCKGPNTPQRPHRRSGIVHLPDELMLVTEEQLSNLAALAPKPQTEIKISGRNEFNLESWVAEHHLPVYSSGSWQGGTRYVLNPCPFNPEHTNKSAYIVQFPSGAISAGCLHNSCRHLGWYDLRDKFEPGWRNKSGQSYPPKTTNAANKTLTVVKMSDVSPEPVKWLWYPYIPLSKLSIIEGNPGEGKTFAMLAIAASITRGTPFIESEDLWEMREPGNVLYLSAEDGAADTIRPRLDKLGADVSRVFLVTGTQQGGDSGVFTFDDLPLLEAAIGKYRPELVVIDPIQAYLGAGIDMHRANETRPVLARLVKLAEAYECAVVCIRHLSKASKTKALFRGMGSIDFAAAARSVLLFGADSQDAGSKAMVQIKSSLAPFGVPQGYVLNEEGFKWTGASSLTANDILGNEDHREINALEDAQDWLQVYLSEGPKLSDIVKAAASKNNIKPSTLRRASEKLGVKKFRPLGLKNPEWLWELPGEEKTSSTETGKYPLYGTEVEGINFEKITKLGPSSSHNNK